VSDIRIIPSGFFVNTNFTTSYLYNLSLAQKTQGSKARQGKARKDRMTSRVTRNISILQIVDMSLKYLPQEKKSGRKYEDG
jgi:hypothetical protein